MAIKRTQFKTEFIFRASPTIVYQFLANIFQVIGFHDW